MYLGETRSLAEECFQKKAVEGYWAVHSFAQK